MKHSITHQLFLCPFPVAIGLIYGCQSQEQQPIYFNQVFLTVSNVDESVKFYTTAFDLQVNNDITWMKTSGEDGSMTERDVRLVLLKFLGQNFVLEIGGRDGFTSDNGKANYAHVGVNVADIVSARDRLVNAGAELVRPISLVQAGGIEAKTAFLLGPDGETIELMDMIKGEF